MNIADRVRLQHMLDSAREALSFAKGRQPQDLTTDRMLALALVKEIEIIGEAASKISDETRALAPGIPWSAMIGMRHRLTHAYFEVDTGVVWSTVETDLPGLVVELEKLLSVSA